MPKVTGLSTGGVLLDSSGNESLVFTTTSSAVNHIGIKNNATNNGLLFKHLVQIQILMFN